MLDYHKTFDNYLFVCSFHIFANSVSCTAKICSKNILNIRIFTACMHIKRATVRET